MMTELHKLSSENLLIKAGDYSLRCLFMFLTVFTARYRYVTICYTTFSLFVTTLFFAVVAVSNLACGLYNRRLYDQAFILVEILCKDLCKNYPTSLSVDRVSSLHNR